MSPSVRAEEIAKNLQNVQERIAAAATKVSRTADSISLIAVTKTFPVSDIEILYHLGVRNFGENRDQEGRVKAPELPNDSIWHFQGQIQSNKLKSILQWADVIHSLDELRHASLLNEILIHSETENSRDIFLQVSLDFLSGEASANRGGVRPEEIPTYLEGLLKLPALNPIGLMAVAPIGVEPDRAFSQLSQIHQKTVLNFPTVANLSAGMSNDFESAILHGATHIRIGSQILGVR
jgi:pyridoxal phosphate enzyme (YggS family)